MEAIFTFQNNNVSIGNTEKTMVDIHQERFFHSGSLDGFFARAPDVK